MLYISETTPPYDRIWDADTFPRIDWGYISTRQRAQEGVFTRLSDPIFADLEQYLRNRLGDRSASACLVKIEILPSAIPNLIRELARRGIDEASLGFTGESDNRRLDDIAAHCNTSLIAENTPAAPPTLPKVDQEAIEETAKQLAARWLATIGPGKAWPSGSELWFKKVLRDPEWRRDPAGKARTEAQKVLEELAAQRNNAKGP